MIIDYLGHSEVLINIKNSDGKYVKILSDAWLSSYSVADLMQRNPVIDIDWENFELDVVFISHSHMDHFDPYSLVKIFSKLKNKPLLLLPETLTYTEKLLKNYLNCEIKILKNKETFQFKWINIQWVIFPDWMNTNEADVMTLAVWNDEEIVFSEIDIVPPDSEEWIGYVYNLFTQKDFKTRLYLSTRNELEGNLTIIDLAPEDRKEFALEYKQKRIEEMYTHYNNILALEEAWIKANIYKLPGFVRGFVGQWIIYPVMDLGCEPLKLQIMSLEENVELETEVAGDFGLFYPMYALNRIWGQKRNSDEARWDCVYQWLGRYVFEDGDLQNVEKIPFVDWKYFKMKQDLDCECRRELKDKPVISQENSEKWIVNNLEEKIQIIQNYLNNVFLPYQMWRLDANLKNLALENDWKYVIQIKYWDNWEKKILGYFVWSLGSNGFSFVKSEEFEKYFKIDSETTSEWQSSKTPPNHPISKISNNLQITDNSQISFNETYFIEDLINFLEGKIELYSNFWQYLQPGTNIYLWECLGANFINNEIILKKFRYHFDLAKKWIEPRERVLKIIK